MNENGSALPPPLAFGIRGHGEAYLDREWLIANRLGAYASSTVAGANTRRYHGLLVAALHPPAGRLTTLSCVMDTFHPHTQPEHECDLSTFLFPDKAFPDGMSNLDEFRDDLAVAFLYRFGEIEVLKEIFLHEDANAVAVRYRLKAGPHGLLRLRPFLAMRDSHQLRRTDTPQRIDWYPAQHGGIGISDYNPLKGDLQITAEDVSDGRAGLRGLPGSFQGQPQWWYRFHYRADLARGQEGMEDLWTPGCFELPLSMDRPAQLTAWLGPLNDFPFDALVQAKRQRLCRVVDRLPRDDTATARLALAADTFIARRHRLGRTASPTIVAGYHWFVDWGRDAMISLPGLLLETRRFDEALGVLRTFAGAVDGGMIPNFFDERGGASAFNSMDASLWFIQAVDKYIQASGDEGIWAGEFGGVVESILRAYNDGTRFDIHADPDDGLLWGGNPDTQLTWMDVIWAGQPVTPRWGKCVEINALWIAALRIAHRRQADPHEKQRYALLAQRAGDAFGPLFWNPHAGCLYDCVRDGEGDRDGSIRPNQIIAVALDDCPLPLDQQRSVVEVVKRELLTPYGLRTLSPRDSRYRGRLGASWESRDKAYHQGTVWPWLIGPFIQAYLKVENYVGGAQVQARQWLAGLEEHLSSHGVGYIAEIFSGDAPHLPGGCIAQAWSVAELLRAKCMLARLRGGKP